MDIQKADYEDKIMVLRDQLRKVSTTQVVSVRFFMYSCELNSPINETYSF